MFVRQIDTVITIDAAPERVWAILTDFARVSSWNPFITSISGDLAPGSHLEVDIEPPGMRAMRFKPRVEVLKPQRELIWLGRAFIPGLFDGRHYFRLADDKGGTRFEHGETFRGLLVPLLRGTFGAIEEGFAAMNAALKRKAERF